MKKIVLGALFLLFGATAALAQDTTATQAVTPIAAPAPTPVGPSIQFEEKRFDFGEIKAGDVVEHTFKLTNNGTLPLIITNVKTTCGCTATDFPKAPVLPGETASITAKFNSAGKRGQQNKVITVESNAIQGNTQFIISTLVTAAN